MDSSVMTNDQEPIDGHFSRSQSLEMELQESLRNTDSIVTDEDSRRLRLRILMQEHENDDLHEQLALGDDRIDNLEQDCEDLRLRLDQAQEDATRRENEGRLLNRELNNVKAELESMNGITTDSTRLLKEKLAIARELASMKPELEYLRTQASFQQSILSEKLSLERQVSTLEVELEAEKRALKHATQKINNVEREEELQRQLDEAHADLKRVQREGEKAVRNLQQELDAELKSTKRAAQKSNISLEKETELQQQVEEALKATRNFQKELDAEQKISKCVVQKLTISQGTETELLQRLDEAQNTIRKLQKEVDAEQNLSKQVVHKSNGSLKKETELQEQVEEVRKELATAKRDADRSRKDAEKELKALEAREVAIESKLDQMRVKHRATKEQLKECQNDLVRAKAMSMKSEPTKAPKTNGKRKAREMSTDETIGTPDGVAARGKRPSIRNRPDQTAVGEKSMFSITPYLNRTVSMAANSPSEELENEEERDDIGIDEQPVSEVLTLSKAPVDVDVSSPTVVQQAKKRKVVEKAPAANQILAESKPSAKNRKPAQRKPRSVSTLEKVTEEVDENEQQSEPKPAETTKISSQPRKKQPKPTPQAVDGDDGDQKKKKRKLLGVNQTLFDEEDGGEAIKRPGKITLGPSRLAGKGALSGHKTGLKPALAVSNMFTAFSPLKKDRRGVGASFLG